MLQTRSERQARATRRWVLFYVVLLATCLALVALSGSGPIQEIRRGFVFAVSPIQGSLSSATRTVTSIVTAFGDIDQLRQDNAALTDRVTTLETQLQQLAVLQAENERLSKTLGVQATVPGQTVAADVVARQATPQERVLTIARGDDAGITIGDPVLSEGGALVGVVTDVGQNWSTVMLISDPRSVVIGFDEQSRVTGEVTGRLDALLAMGNVPSTQQLTTNDLVVTAGTETRDGAHAQFPHGLVIGRIVEVKNDPSAVIQTALIQPATDLDSMQRVLVMTAFTPPPSPRPSATPHH